MGPVETSGDRGPRDELVLAKLETLTAKLERLETKAQSQTKEPQSWWVIAAQLLALPALIVTMYFQLSQSGAQRETADLSRAQTVKTQTEELKTRAELQLLLDNLQAKRAASVQAYEEQISKTLPQLEATLAKLDTLNKDASWRTSQENLARYLVIWVFLQAIGLLFGIVSLFWSSLVSVSSAAFYAYRPTKVLSEVQRQRRDRRLRYASLLTPLLYPLPEVVRIAIDVTLFGAVLIPLFDLMAAGLSSPVTFSAVLGDLSRLNFAAAIDKVRDLVFP